EVYGQAAVTGHLDLGGVLEGLCDQGHAFLRLEHQRLERPVIDGHHHLVEHSRRAGGDVDVAVMNGVERSGKQGSNHAFSNRSYETSPLLPSPQNLCRESASRACSGLIKSASCSKSFCASTRAFSISFISVRLAIRRPEA